MYIVHRIQYILVVQTVMFLSVQISKGTSFIQPLSNSSSYFRSQQIRNQFKLFGMDTQAITSPVVEYYHVWADNQGATHITKSYLTHFEYKEYSPPSAPQWVFSGQINKPKNITFTNLPIGYFGDWHVNPFPQWIVSLKGTWWVESTDGTRVEMGPGVLSYGDDGNSTIQGDGKIGHLTGVVGDESVSLMVIQCEELQQ
eukprot:TRINITY_DN6863_c0_g1_i5.p1 TRINITY_DN6863_c0_g1~~TRINITY_DN6863_c0_g1_i5.p1  ORF type:complete len:199 (-),score=19.13 TRINITY_DN6863_c0_g1_i5:98-694(-)